jgi:hypothetical protein
MKDLLFFFKCKAGLLDIQLSDYVQNQLAPKYNFRSYMMWITLLILNVEQNILKTPIFLEL